MTRRRVGIMGGTFNPIHYSHLILAENAYKSFNLDSVVFIPNDEPPHKSNKALVSDEHRLKMLHLAVDDVSYFKISTIEIDRGGYSYSSDTMTELCQRHPDTDYYFIMGADSLFQIEKWHEARVFMSHCGILAAVRDHVTTDEMHKQMDYLAEKYGVEIHLLPVPDIQLSSRFIRQRIQNGQTIKYFLPKEVEAYIYEEGLYATVEPGE